MKRNWLQIGIVLFVVLWSLGAHGQTKHEIDLSASDTACTTTAPCTLQVYRAVGSCPATANLQAMTLLSGTVGGSATATGETWNYPDTGALQDNTTYFYFVTATFISGGAASLPSACFSGTTPGQTQTSPVKPVLTGKVVS